MHILKYIYVLYTLYLENCVGVLGEWVAVDIRRQGEVVLSFDLWWSYLYYP